MPGLTADELIDCYRTGVFPMGEAREDPRVMIVEPHRRGVIHPERFHLPRRLARLVRQDAFEVTADEDFEAVVAACAEPSPSRPETWINRPIQDLYGELHRRGVAHCLACRREGVLAGGLYGVSLGGVFFGESMFSMVRDASKVALVHLMARLRAGGYRLLDCQFLTPHLARFGAVEMPQAEYLKRLAAALELGADFHAAGPRLSGREALALLA